MPPPPSCALAFAPTTRDRAATIGSIRRTHRILASPDDEAECSSHGFEPRLAFGHDLAVHVEAGAVGHLDLDLVAVQVVRTRVVGQAAAAQVVGEAHQAE